MRQTLDKPENLPALLEGVLERRGDYELGLSFTTGMGRHRISCFPLPGFEKMCLAYLGRDASFIGLRTMNARIVYLVPEGTDKKVLEQRWHYPPLRTVRTTFQHQPLIRPNAPAETVLRAVDPDTGRIIFPTGKVVPGIEIAVKIRMPNCGYTIWFGSQLSPFRGRKPVETEALSTDPEVQTGLVLYRGQDRYWDQVREAWAKANVLDHDIGRWVPAHSILQLRQDARLEPARVKTAFDALRVRYEATFEQEDMVDSETARKTMELLEEAYHCQLEYIKWCKEQATKKPEPAAVTEKTPPEELSPPPETTPAITSGGAPAFNPSSVPPEPKTEGRRSRPPKNGKKKNKRSDKKEE